MIELTLDIIPVACGRPRFGKNGQVYTPKKTTLFKNEVLYTLLSYKHELKLMDKIITLYDKPLSLTVKFLMPIPKAKQSGKNKIEEGASHISKPDTDNLIKAVKDCMSGIFYKDDRQVCHEVTNKVYSYKPGIEIRLMSHV